MQEKNKSYEKTNPEFVELVSIPRKLHPFKNPHRLPTEPMGIHHSPHTHGSPANVTDRQTDGETTYHSNSALRTHVLREVKMYQCSR